jgi:predicted ArsR family transcriptional regulator
LEEDLEGLESAEGQVKMEEETKRQLYSLIERHERELREKGDKKIRELAESLNLPVNTVRKHV